MEEEPNGNGNPNQQQNQVPVQEEQKQDEAPQQQQAYQNPLLNQEPQQQQLSENIGEQRLIGVAPSKFSDSIPSKKALMDFFQNHLGLYCPPEREFTAKFAKDVLSGDKCLLEQS